MENKKIIIGHIFKEQLDHHSDSGNIFPLVNALEERSIPYELKEFSLNEELVLEGIDLLLLGNGDSRGKRLVLDYLKDYKDKIKQYIDTGGAALFTGTSYYILGENWEKKDEVIPGLGILDLKVEKGDEKDIEEIVLLSVLEGRQCYLTGFLENKELEKHNYRSLGRIIKGSDNRDEGIIYKHMIGTGLLGPVLVYNQELVNLLLKWAIKGKYPDYRFKSMKNPLEVKYKKKVFGLKNV